MAIINKPWTLQQALDRGMEFYDVTITDWGDIGAAADPVNTNGVGATPISDFPAQGIVIAPESIIDRCRLQYNPGQVIATLIGAVPPDSVLLGKDQPYIGRLPAPYLAHALIADFFGDTFTQADGTSGTFGTALTNPPFQPPSLTLRLLLNGNGIAPGGRPRTEICDSFVGFSGAGTEDLIRIQPVHGRRRVRVSVANLTAATTVAVRVGVVRNCAVRDPVPPPLAFDRSIEDNAVAPTAVAGPGVDSFVINPLIGEYITLYGELTVGGAAVLQWSIEAED